MRAIPELTCEGPFQYEEVIYDEMPMVNRPPAWGERGPTAQRDAAPMAVEYSNVRSLRKLTSGAVSHSEHSEGHPHLSLAVPVGRTFIPKKRFGTQRVTRLP